MGEWIEWGGGARAYRATPSGPAGAADVGALEQEIRRHGGETEFHTDPGTHHWFFEDARPEYEAVAAATAWARSLAFLRRHLTPG